jgi:hypothetical protein
MKKHTAPSKPPRDISWTHQVHCPPDHFSAGSHGKMAEDGFGHCTGVVRESEIREDQRKKIR